MEILNSYEFWVFLTLLISVVIGLWVGYSKTKNIPKPIEDAGVEILQKAKEYTEQRADELSEIKKKGQT